MFRIGNVFTKKFHPSNAVPRQQNFCPYKELKFQAVSHDNRLLAAGSCDKIIRVWSLLNGEPVAVLSRHSGGITAVNFCPMIATSDSHYLASTSGDGSVTFWKFSYNEFNHATFEDTPTRFHEKIRPGQAQIICASFSPGGVFLCVGSADHNVRVYKMDCPDGPQRILEDDSHQERVDSIQWCNTPDLRFLSGSKDGTARIWTYSNHKWSSIVLNMSTGDNREKKPTQSASNLPQNSQPGPSSNGDLNRSSQRRQPSAANNGQSVRPVRAAAVAAISTLAQVVNRDNMDDSAHADASAANEKMEKQVTMVAW